MIRPVQVLGSLGTKRIGVDHLPDTVSAALKAADHDQSLVPLALKNLERWWGDPTLSEDRPQLLALAERGEGTVLLDAFRRFLSFGTGGCRGAVGIGSNRFNFRTLGALVQGHAKLLTERFPGEEILVVLAFDVRSFHDRRGVYVDGVPNPLLGVRSADFARHAATVYAGNGVAVSLADLEGEVCLSTPELSLAIRDQSAHGGMMISASHNHPDDNGAKVYNQHGGQDTPPEDEILAQRVEQVGEISVVSFGEAVKAGRVQRFDPSSLNEQYRRVVGQSISGEAITAQKVVFTNLHGVGGRTVVPLLEDAGFDVTTVPSQEVPDGRFPGVPFLAPNPEVPSAFAAGEVVANEVGADLIVATDPDADRIGVEARTEKGDWRFFNGNEILCLLARFLLEQKQAAGSLPKDAFVLTTVVSSRLLGRIARSYGCAVVDDLLVGFKYMAEVLASLEASGRWRDLKARPESLVLAGEEAHGVLLTSDLRDKDGGGAALALATLHAVQQERGSSLGEALDDIFRRFGVVVHRQRSAVMTGTTGASCIQTVQESLRKEPPQRVGSRSVEAMGDLVSETDWRGPIRSGTDYANRNVICFDLVGGARVTVRPSGTEPKIKLYVEVPGVTPREDMDDSTLVEQRIHCEAIAMEIERDFERLMLDRAGIRLSAGAEALSPLISIEHKIHFSETFLPALEKEARSGPVSEAFIDQGLAGYGTDVRTLVAKGVGCWLGENHFPGEVVDRIETLFPLEGKG